jgi:hypothetical protein
MLMHKKTNCTQLETIVTQNARISAVRFAISLTHPPSVADLYREIDRLRWELDAKGISTEGLG